MGVVSLAEPDCEENYNDMILEQKRIYSKSWTRVLYHIFSSDTDIPRSILDAPGKLGDRYCRMIKEKFAGFNKEMDEITAAQRLERANSYLTTRELPGVALANCAISHIFTIIQIKLLK